MTEVHKIEIKNLTLGFGKGRKARILCSGINATACSGQVIALVGANGKGKSTLLKTLCSLLPLYRPLLPDAGRTSVAASAGSGATEILFDGEPLAGLSGNELSARLAYVPSRLERVEGLSVHDMVGINRYYKTNWVGTLGSVDEDAVLNALKLVGLDSMVDADCSTLSDGEFQRVAIAAALAQESAAIVLDEPTAFLDIANKFNATQLLSYIAHQQNKIVLFSTHDLQHALRCCDRIWLMAEEGEPQFVEGSTAEIIESGAINRLFSTPDIRFNSQLCTFERI